MSKYIKSNQFLFEFLRIRHFHWYLVHRVLESSAWAGWLWAWGLGSRLLRSLTLLIPTWGACFLLWVKDVLLGRRHSYRCGLLSWFTILQCLVALIIHGPISWSFFPLSHCLLNQSYCHIAPENKIVTKYVLNSRLII